MNLNQFAADRRRAILAQLEAKSAPAEAEFSDDALRTALTKGRPQLGPTHFSPRLITFEYLFPDPVGVPFLFSVHVVPPERIVWMAIPDWVISQIWEGEVSGSFQFESDARRMLDDFSQGL